MLLRIIYLYYIVILYNFDAVSPTEQEIYYIGCHDESVKFKLKRLSFTRVNALVLYCTTHTESFSLIILSRILNVVPSYWVVKLKPIVITD